MIQEKNELNILKEPESSHLQSAQKLWNLNSPCIFIRHLANHVYQSTQIDQKVILRLSSTSYRSRDEIESELNWVEYLHQNNMTVSRPILSVNNQNIELLTNSNGEYYACLFSFANGKPLDATKEISQVLLNKWIQTAAEFHNLSVNYDIRQSAHRSQWNTESVYRDVELAILGNEFEANNAFVNDFKRASLWLKSLPQTKSNFGLIHADFHLGNFFADETGNLNVFDFDDCCYHWYMYDFAVVIVSRVFALVNFGSNIDLSAYSVEFLRNYYNYALEPRADIDILLKFIRYRMTSVLLWIQNKLEKKLIPSSTSQWLESYQKWTRSEYSKLPDFL